jgi:lipopolysaccharide transport system permease protein
MRFPGSFFLRNLRDRRTLLLRLVRRDFDLRYIGSAAGWLWGVIHPLVLLLSWTFVFHWCLNIKLPVGEVTDNYPLYLFCGFLPWLLFQETVQRSASCLLDHGNLIKKTIFPSEVAPLSIFFSSLVNHFIGLALVIVAVAVWLHHISLKILFLPVYMVFLGLFAVGVAWAVAALNVYLRDTAQVMSVILTLWFWVTPIFITEKQYPEQVRFLIAVNPMAYLVRAYRDRLLSYERPNMEELAVVAVYSIVTFLAGGLFFRHLKRGFADVL